MIMIPLLCEWTEQTRWLALDADGLLTLASSPQGRIFQVEYASEAVKQGSVVVGIVSKTHAVLVALKVVPLLVFSISKDGKYVELTHPPAQRRRALLIPKENYRH